MGFPDEEGGDVGVEYGRHIAGHELQRFDTALQEQGLLSLLGQRQLAILAVGHIFHANQALGIPCYAGADAPELLFLAGLRKVVEFICG